MRHRQRGITFLGLLILVAFVGLFVYAGIRLTPAYLEYLKVSKAFESLKSEGGPGSTPQAFRIALEKRFEIDDVSSLDWHDVEITRDGSDWVVHAQWQAPEPFVANVDFVVNFEKTVRIPIS
jgi:hypothetical protein